LIRIRALAPLLAGLALAGCRTPPPSDPQSIVITPAPPAPAEPPAPRDGDDPSAIELAMGWSGLCARVGGRVHCSALDDPGRPLSAAPALGGIDDAVSLTAGPSFVCLATRRGTVHCTGDNQFGQLGARLREERTDRLVQVAGITDARRVVAGTWHACAVLASGRAACWGRNERGQTGSSVAYAAEARELDVPAEVPQISGVTSIAGAFSTTCATTEARDVWCWGEPKHDEHRAARGAHSEEPAPLPALAGVADVSAGESAFCGVKEGEVTCWGDLWALLPRSSGRDGRAHPLPTPRSARRVRVANSHGCALLRDGAVACFGAGWSGALGREVDERESGQPARIVEGLPRAVDVAVGASMSCAVTEAHEVYCWGAFPGGKGRHEVAPRKIPVTG